MIITDMAETVRCWIVGRIRRSPARVSLQ